jgi:hypothetical protein
MKPKTKVKQIVVRFDQCSYGKISEHAESEHRTLGEFVRHAALEYIEKSRRTNESQIKERGEQP